jgi:hypothetical protein
VTIQAAAADQARATRTAWIVWAALVAVTVTGGLVSDSDGSGDILIAVIVLFGLGKTWLIVQYFMEVRHAPRWLQIVVTGWMLSLWTTLLVLVLRA